MVCFVLFSNSKHIDFPIVKSYDIPAQLVGKLSDVFIATSAYFQEEERDGEYAFLRWCSGEAKKRQTKNIDTLVPVVLQQRKGRHSNGAGMIW